MRWLALPLAGWLLCFLLAPLFMVVGYSLFERGPYGDVVMTLTLGNYARIFEPLYLDILLRSLRFAALSTAACLMLGYPLAYAMATARPRTRSLLFLLLMVPFLTNFIVRVYAIRVVLAAKGPLSMALVAIGLLDAPTSFNDSPLAVIIGMITTYLPFMVLPLYVVMEKLDFSLLDAARDLGARGRDVFLRILLPLTSGGIASGCLLVFIPTLGEFMIPDLLGGARTMLLGNLITEQFLKARNWPFGSALTVLIVLVAPLCLVAARSTARSLSGAARSNG